MFCLGVHAESCPFSSSVWKRADRDADDQTFNRLRRLRKSDERILENGYFVEEILLGDEERLERK